jgi:uncharacterized protein YgiM (DUF1202 family)
MIMRKYLPATLGIAFMVAAPAALAERSPMEIATVKAATDCVAKAALNNPNITTLYQENRLKEVTDWIVLRSNACENSLRAMRLLHDQLYGKGTGQVFLRGDYLSDLPRAVRERIKVVLESGVVARGGHAESAAPPSTGPLIAGTELMVVGIAENDVLNIREDATENSRIIGMVTPDTKGGVVYSGDSQGKWVFIRYEDRVG